jgi:signal transduction histidine kinase
MAMEPLELLRHVFPSLNEQEVEHLASLAKVNTYPPDTILCQEGAYEDVFYLIADGQVIVTKRFDEHGDLVLRRAGPGEFFGEMAIIQEAPRSATITTLEETTCLELDKNSFLSTLSHNAELALSMIRTTFDRVRANDQMAIQELRQAFETLERLDHAKLDFIHVAAHELRTPLTVMRGYASMLISDERIKNDPMLLEVTQGIVSGSQRLHEIVNNMLDVQKIDMDTLQAAAIPVYLPLVIRGLIGDFQEALDSRRLTMGVHFEGEHVFIEGDPGLITKAFYHLLSNAIKYTPDGGRINIICTFEENEEIGRVAHIRVTDSGIGVAPEYQEIIFEKFYQIGEVALHSSGKTAFKAGGPGLGLAIARGAINAHGGRIWVESDGHDEELLPGSTFHVLLPVQARRRPHPELKEKTLIPGIRATNT